MSVRNNVQKVVPSIFEWMSKRLKSIIMLPFVGMGCINRQSKKKKFWVFTNQGCHLTFWKAKSAKFGYFLKLSARNFAFFIFEDLAFFEIKLLMAYCFEQGNLLQFVPSSLFPADTFFDRLEMAKHYFSGKKVCLFLSGFLKKNKLNIPNLYFFWCCSKYFLDKPGIQ